MSSINKINNYANNNKDKMSLPQLHRETQEGGLVLSANAMWRKYLLGFQLCQGRTEILHHTSVTIRTFWGLFATKTKMQPNQRELTDTSHVTYHSSKAFLVLLEVTEPIFIQPSASCK